MVMSGYINQVEEAIYVNRKILSERRRVQLSPSYKAAVPQLSVNITI